MKNPPASTPSTPRPVGRRPGDPEDTKSTILDAARQLFSEVGFDRATIRAIAARADVDPALVIHHFGSKQRLFVAAHELPFDPADLLADVSDLPSAERGAHIARLYLTMMESQSAPALSLLRAAATNDAAATMMKEFITTSFIAHASTLARGPDGPRRLALAGAQLIGVAFGRLVLELEPLASATIEQLVDTVGPVIQRYLDETIEPSGVAAPPRRAP